MLARLWHSVSKGPSGLSRLQEWKIRRKLKRFDKIRAQDPELFARVETILRELDPMALISQGAPSDEYSFLVGSILPRLREVQTPRDVTRLLHEEVLHLWFAAEIAGPESLYEPAGQLIWEAWSAFRRTVPNHDAAKLTTATRGRHL